METSGLTTKKGDEMTPVLEKIWAEMIQLALDGHGDKAFEKFKEAIAITRASK